MFAVLQSAARWPLYAVVATFCWFGSVGKCAGADGQRYAVLVGVENYFHPKLREPNPLKYSVDDVTSLADVLSAVGYQVTLMTDDTGKQSEKLLPTRSNIEREIASVLEKCRPEDTVVLAFAGHGHQFQAEPDAYFCPMDARPFKDAVESLLSINDVYRRMEQSFAGVKVILVDACRNDPNPARGRGLDADAAPPPPKGVGALFSCSAGQRAYEHDTLKHGVFFHFVLEGLKGGAKDEDGEVTFETLSQYVRKKVPNKMKELDLGSQQPNLKADLAGVPPVLVDRRPDNPGSPVPVSPAVTQPTTKLRGRAFLSTDRLPRGGAARVAIQLEIPDRCYLMGTNPDQGAFASAEMKVSVASGLGITVGAVRLPAGEPMKFEAVADPARVIRGTAWILADLSVPATATGLGEVALTVRHRLDNEQVCFAPSNLDLKFRVAVAPANDPVRPIHDAEFRDAEKYLASAATPSRNPFGPNRSDNSLQMLMIPVGPDLWMGASEITQNEWNRVMGTVPWTGRDGVAVGVNYPAVYVSWNDARLFCETLNRTEQKEKRLAGGLSYRLPTTEEWEQACLAGSKSKYAHGDDVTRLDDFAWYSGSVPSGSRTYQKVTLKKANSFGLFDMHGNVAEWCDGDPSSPLQPFRGGSFLSPAGQVTATSGDVYNRTDRYRDLGFRVMLAK